MPRPRFRREPCECRDCLDVPDAQPLSGRKHAAALLDPPPKCVVVYGDAFLALPSRGAADAVHRGEDVPLSGTAGREASQDSLQAAACPHLHRVARDGCSGFVALPAPAGAAPCLLCSCSACGEGRRALVIQQQARDCALQACRCMALRHCSCCSAAKLRKGMRTEPQAALRTGRYACSSSWEWSCEARSVLQLSRRF